MCTGQATSLERTQHQSRPATSQSKFCDPCFPPGVWAQGLRADAGRCPALDSWGTNSSHQDRPLSADL